MQTGFSRRFSSLATHPGRSFLWEGPRAGIRGGVLPGLTRLAAIPVLTWSLCATALVSSGLICAGPARAASATDALPPDPAEIQGELILPRSADRLAEGQTWYVLGIFAEENEGPERALQIYRRVLDRDPGFLSLSLGVAHEFLRRGDVAEALATVKDAAKARPEAYLPEFVAAEIYYRHLSKLDLSLQHARRAVRLAPGEFASYELIWEIHTHRGELKSSLAILDDAAAQEGASAAFYLALAEHHRRWQSADSTQAAADTARRRLALSRAVEAAPEDPDILMRAADLHAVYQETEQAAAFYERAYAHVPQWPFLRDKLAVSLIEAGRGADAVGYLEEMLADNPQNLPALDQLADLALEAGEIEDAILYRQRALFLQPRDLRRHHELIELLLSNQKQELAIIHLGQAMETFPRSGVFSYLMGATLTRAGRAQEAVGFFEQALAESPYVSIPFVGGDFYFEFGMAAEQAGRYELAADLFRKAIEIDPANAARASNYLGYMWVDRNENLDEAEVLIRQALAAEPNNGAYLDSLGWLYYRRGEFAEALSHLLRAAEALPHPDPVVYEHIGDAYRALGRHPEALLFYQKSLQLDANNSDLADKLEELSSRTAGVFPERTTAAQGH